jgi:hypothetical protein
VADPPTTLNTTIGSKTANSYCTAAEADAILTGLGIYTLTSWTALQTAGKEFRLKLAAKLTDSMFHYIGWPVYMNQALAFPRRIPTSDYPTIVRGLMRWDPYWGYGGDLFGASDIPGEWTWDEDDPIVIPDDIKTVQACIAYAVVHKRLTTQSDPADGPDDALEISSMSIGGLSMSAASGPLQRLDGTPLEAVTSSEHMHIYLLLEPYVSQIAMSPGPRGPVLLDEVA